MTPDRFHRAIEAMPAMLAALRAAPTRGRADRLRMPKAPGVYLFTEAGAPIYVGQTRNIRARYDQHTGVKSTHNSASFAFLVARATARDAGISLEMKRAALERHEHFVPHFTAAKTRVAEMGFQFILNADPIERSLFEIYAAIQLGTERFNSFETH